MGEFDDFGNFYYVMSVGQAERYIFSSFFKRVAQAKSFLYNACCSRGERKAILIYISFALYFLHSVSVLLKQNTLLLSVLPECN